MKQKFYVTTAIPYLNASAHLGHALEYVQADVLARYYRQIGYDVWFLTGSDEHGSKIVHAANMAGKSPIDFVNEMVVKFKSLLESLNISNDDFIRTSDQKRHWPTAQKIWQALADKDDLYKKNYKGLYCIGHEAFIKKSELEDDLCPLHKSKPQEIEEENWFFKLTKYKDQVRQRIESNELRIVPETRKNEVLKLLDDAEDVSFSRPSQDISWGIPVPGDPTQTMYVWADALTNYISALGYADNDPKFYDFWPADAQLIGKDILRFHAMIWPAILLSVGLDLPQALYVHGFITVDGHKMSKTVGNIIDPFQLVEKYGAEVVRYFLLREIPSGDDGDFSYKHLEARYNGDLANGLGNLVQRVATLIDDKMDGELIYSVRNLGLEDKVLLGFQNDQKYRESIESFRLHDALGEVWAKIALANQYIDDKKPWATIKYDEAEFLQGMTVLTGMLHHIAWLLVPLMPATSQAIFEIFGDSSAKVIKENYKFLIKRGQGLFPRL